MMIDFISTPVPIAESLSGNRAFDSLPMGDWLWLIKKEIPAKCCQDPEYCVSATCVTCPWCLSEDTTRTTPPDEKNVSEFVCNLCGEYFTAINPLT